MSYPVAFAGRVEWDREIVSGHFDTPMQRSWNRLAVPAALVVAAVVAVLVGIIGQWYVGVGVFVVLGAILGGVGRMSDRRFAAIVHRDLCRMAMLIGAPAEYS